MSGLVDKITKAVMGISAIVVFVITFLQVLCRFVLKSPLPGKLLWNGVFFAAQ